MYTQCLEHLLMLSFNLNMEMHDCPLAGDGCSCVPFLHPRGYDKGIWI